MEKLVVAVFVMIGMFQVSRNIVSKFEQIFVDFMIFWF